MIIGKDGICWYEGRSKIVVTPWAYTIPNFSFINKNQYQVYLKSLKKQDEKPKNIIVNPVPVSTKLHKPAPLNQQSLF